MPERFKVVCIPCKALYKCADLPFTFLTTSNHSDDDIDNNNNIYYLPRVPVVKKTGLKGKLELM